MELKRYFDDFAVGDTATSPGRTVTETDIYREAGYGYGGRSHFDREYMKDSEWGDVLVQNTVLIAISSALWHELPGWDYEVPIAYGRDDMRFTAGAFPGDTLHLDAEVVEKRIRRKDLDAGRDRGIINIREWLLNQDDELVMIDDHLSLLPFSPGFSPEESDVEIE